MAENDAEIELHITKPEIFDKYPCTLTFDEFDDIVWDFEKQFGLDDDRSLRDICQSVFDFMQKRDGTYVLYTQVDGDDGDRIYSRGHHLCNRTGIWWVVKRKDFENRNEVCGPCAGGDHENCELVECDCK